MALVYPSTEARSTSRGGRAPVLNLPGVMDVRCERCGTVYAIDAARVGTAMTVRCTACSHVFRLESPEEAPSEGTPTPTRPVQDAREWLVRTEAGRLISFRELTTLQKWIVEGRISRDDEISRNGKTWKRLGNIAELEAFFSVYEKARTFAELVQPATFSQSGLRGSDILGAADPTADAPPAPSSSPVQRVEPPRAPTAPPAYGEALAAAPSSSPAIPPLALSTPSASRPIIAPFRESVASGVWAASEPFAQPHTELAAAPAAFPSHLPSEVAFTDDLPLLEASPPIRAGLGTRGWGVALLLAGLFGGAFLAALAYTRWPRPEPVPPAAVVAPLIQQAHVSMDLDTDAGRRRAARHLDEAERRAPSTEGVALARAELALREVEAARRTAQNRRAEAARLDTELEGWRTAVSRAQALRRPLPPRPEAADPRRFERQARALEAEAEAELSSAEAWWRAAKSPETEPLRTLVQARLQLETGAAEAARATLEGLELPEGRMRTEQAYLTARLARAGDGPPDEALRDQLEGALQSWPSHNRARVMAASLALDAGDPTRAQSLLAPVLREAPNHDEARGLEARIEVALAPPAPSSPEPAPKPVAKPLGYFGWLRIGHRHREAGRVEAALDAYGRAAELRRGEAEPIVGKGWCFLDLDRPRLALVSFERAAGVEPSFSESQLGIGETQLRLGDPRAALAALRRYVAAPDADRLERTVAERKIRRLEAEAGASTSSTVAGR